MRDKWLLLDRIWLLPIVLVAILGVFLVALRMAEILRKVRADSSSRSSLVGAAGNSRATQGQNSSAS